MGKIEPLKGPDTTTLIVDLVQLQTLSAAVETYISTIESVLDPNNTKYYIELLREQEKLTQAAAEGKLKTLRAHYMNEKAIIDSLAPEFDNGFMELSEKEEPIKTASRILGPDGKPL